MQDYHARRCSRHVTMGILLAAVAACGGGSPPPSPPPQAPPEEPAPPPPPPPVAEPEPEAGHVQMSTAFLVGGDMPSSIRDGITEQVVQAIKDGIPLFRRCYAKFGAEDQGEIDVELVIKPNGTIALLRPGKGTLTNESLVNCTVRAFEQLSFPSPPAEYSIVAPIQFKPE